MLDKAVEQYISGNTQAHNLQTTSQLPKNLHQFALDFQRDSQLGVNYSRKQDGLGHIDQLVGQALATRATDAMRTAHIAKQLVMALHSWCHKREPLTNAPISASSYARRQLAIKDFLAGVYICYQYTSEAATAEPAALELLQRKADIPLSLYQYRFSRSGFHISQAPNALYRGDTRPPAFVWHAGGFYPRMEQIPRHDPHFGGTSQQVISTTTDPQLAAHFANYSRACCPVRFHCIYQEDTLRAVEGFIYEIDKSGHQCVEVAGVAPGHDMAFLAVPNTFIRRFKMRYYSSDDHKILTSDWLNYDDANVHNLKLLEDKQAWEQLKHNAHIH